jgi:hypothetical protein
MPFVVQPHTIFILLGFNVYSRPPSPPPMRAYRAPITAAAHRNDGQDMFRSPASLLSFLASNQALSRASGNDHQVDIQIAILPTTTL